MLHCNQWIYLLKATSPGLLIDKNLFTTDNTQHKMNNTTNTNCYIIESYLYTTLH